MRRVYVVGTHDTKGEELAFLAGLVAAQGLPVVRVDVGTRQATSDVDVTAAKVATFHPAGAGGSRSRRPRHGGRGDGRGVRRFIATRDDIAGIIGIGGGGGTSIITAGMRELPLGVPKIMVSTLASGDVRPMSTSPTSS